MMARVHRRSALVMLALVVLPAIPGSAASKSAAAPVYSFETYFRKLGYAPIPLKRAQGNHLVVEARLNGARRKFLVDTGWSWTAVERGLTRKWKTPAQAGMDAEALGLPYQILTNGLEMPLLELGDAAFTNLVVEAASLHASNLGASGVIGCDFLLRHDCLIDCAELKLYVRSEPLPPLRRNLLQSSLTAGNMRKVRLQTTPALAMTCEAKINGEPVTLLLDTGCWWTTLDSGLEKLLKLAPRSTGASIVGVGGRRTLLYRAPFKSIELDGTPIPAVTKDVGVASLDDWLGKDRKGMRQIDGLLGMELLTVSSALIDFGGEALWLLPKAE